MPAGFAHRSRDPTDRRRTGYRPWACRSTRPAWVRDAVFYQIFPDRFARSARVAAAGPFEPWDAPPTHAGFKGGDLYGVVDRLDELGELGITALYLNPVFASASNHRYNAYDYLDGRSAARRRRRVARAARRGPRTRHAGDPRRGLQSLRAWLVAVPPRARERGGLAVPRLVPSRSATSSRPGRDSTPIPTAATPGTRRSAIAPGGGCRPCPSSTSPEPADARVPARRRRALAPVRDRRLAARRPRRDRGPGLLAGVPPALPGDRPARPISSARSGTSRPTGSRATGSTP